MVGMTFTCIYLNFLIYLSATTQINIYDLKILNVQIMISV